MKNEFDLWRCDTRLFGLLKVKKKNYIRGDVPGIC